MRDDIYAVGEDGTIRGFTEKPSYEFLVSMGVNAFDRSVVELIPRGRHFGFDDLMLRMIGEGVEVGSYVFDGVWHDIGRPDDYQVMLAEYERDPRVFLPEGA